MVRSVTWRQLPSPSSQTHTQGTHSRLSVHKVKANRVPRSRDQETPGYRSQEATGACAHRLLQRCHTPTRRLRRRGIPPRKARRCLFCRRHRRRRTSGGRAPPGCTAHAVCGEGGSRASRRRAGARGARRERSLARKGGVGLVRALADHRLEGVAARLRQLGATCEQRRCSVDTVCRCNVQMCHAHAVHTRCTRDAPAIHTPAPS